MPRPKRTKITSAKPLPLIRSRANVQLTNASEVSAATRSANHKGRAGQTAEHDNARTHVLTTATKGALSPMSRSRQNHQHLEQGQVMNNVEEDDVIVLAAGKAPKITGGVPMERTIKHQRRSSPQRKEADILRARLLNSRISEYLSQNSMSPPTQSSRKSFPAPKRDQDFESYILQNSSSPAPGHVHPSSDSRHQARPSLMAGTPLLSLSNFKRRPRQPSLLRMVQAQDIDARGQEEDHMGSDVDDSILRELDALSPANDRFASGGRDGGNSAGTRLSSRGRKRKANELDDELEESTLPSSPPGPEIQIALDAESDDVDDNGVEIEVFGETNASESSRQTLKALHPKEQRRLSRPSRERPGTGHKSDKELAHSIEQSPQLPATENRRRSSRPFLDRHKKQTRSTANARPKGKWQPLTQRSSTPPVIATSPISTSPPDRDDLRGTQEVIVLGEERLFRPPQIQRVKVTHRTSDGRPSVLKRDPKAAALRTRASRDGKGIFPTTDALRALLPKRRRGSGVRQRHDSLEIPSSSPPFSSLSESEESDADNSSDEAAAYSKSVGAIKQRQRQRQSSRKPLAARTVNANALRSNARSGKTTSEKATHKSKTTPAQQRTYVRPRRHGLADADALVDVENDDSTFSPAPDTPDDQHQARAALGTITKTKKHESAELNAASEKFKQVDDWELSFESCDVGGASSSPWR